MAVSVQLTRKYRSKKFPLCGKSDQADVCPNASFTSSKLLHLQSSKTELFDLLGHFFPIPF